jgi:UDP-N-acetyl-D-glucosamine dehydrogenase
VTTTQLATSARLKPTPDGLQARIDDRSARIAIIGMGYVGLPLAAALARAGFEAIGIDLDRQRVDTLKQGRSPIVDVSSAELAELLAARKLTVTREYDALDQTDVVFVCVPTPFDRHKTPDLSSVLAASHGISRRLRPGQLVVLQSTTYPGTTQEAVQPILESTGLRAGHDFWLAFSPERIDPGVHEHTVANTPKVVGGVSATCADLAAAVLRSMTSEVCVVSSPRVAEMTKLLENVFRAVNIALVNELALLCERMDINVWEVIEAAATKPFGFMPFVPGPGVGGHCIPVDPYYLSWKAREYDFSTRFIELAADVNQAMPRHVAALILQAVHQRGVAAGQASVLVIGTAFKPDVDDARNSPAERIIATLLRHGVDVSYHDPLIATFCVGGDAFMQPPVTLNSVGLTDEVLGRADCVAILVRHSSIDFERVVRAAAVIVDAVNATHGHVSDRIIRLGAPHPPRAQLD